MLVDELDKILTLKRKTRDEVVLGNLRKYNSKRDGRTEVECRILWKKWVGDKEESETQVRRILHVLYSAKEERVWNEKARNYENYSCSDDVGGGPFKEDCSLRNRRVKRGNRGEWWPWKNEGLEILQVL